MSRQGDIGRLRLVPAHAAVVGALIEARVSVPDVQDTPLEPLPGLGRKLRAAARRRRTAGLDLDIWNVERTEALAGFHYLVSFSLPNVPESFLTADERLAVREVALAIAQVLLARRGPRRLDRTEIERQLRAFAAPPSLEEDAAHPPDERWSRRLRIRLAKDDALRATLVHPLPTRLFRLLAPPEISR
jgi:hypothetical protein